MIQLTQGSDKFGGAGNDGYLADVSRIVRTVDKMNADASPFLVFSARGKTTQQLRMAYDQLISSNDKVGELTAKKMLSLVFRNHWQCVISLFAGLKQRDPSALGIIDNELQTIKNMMGFLEEEAQKALDRIIDNSKTDPREKAKAVIESVGERLATVCLMIPVFRIQGYLVLHLPAMRFMTPRVSDVGNYTGAVLDWTKSLKVFEREYGRVTSGVFSLAKGLADQTVLNGKRAVFVTEGFIGQGDTNDIVTFGTDSSDLSSVFIAWAMHKVLQKTDAETRPATTLWKIVGEGVALQNGDLRDLWTKTLVSRAALVAAQDHGVAVRIGNLQTGQVYTYEPLVRAV